MKRNKLLLTCGSMANIFSREVFYSVWNNTLLLLWCPQLKVTQEPRAKKGRRNQSVEPKKEVSCAPCSFQVALTQEMFSKLWSRQLLVMCTCEMHCHRSNNTHHIWTQSSGLSVIMCYHWSNNAYVPRVSASTDQVWPSERGTLWRFLELWYVLIALLNTKC